MQNTSLTFFAPQLFINDCAAAIDFYKKAFGVVEIFRLCNDDGSVHVAELSFDGCIFHIHEPTEHSIQENTNSPENVGSTTILMGVFVDDPHAVVKRAVDAGAKETTPVTDYEYNYRQGKVTDPFGHQWLIEKKI